MTSTGVSFEEEEGFQKFLVPTWRESRETVSEKETEPSISLEHSMTQVDSQKDLEYSMAES